MESPEKPRAARRPARRGIAAAVGRWSVRHRWLAIAAWLAFVAVAALAGNSLGTVDLGDERNGTGESARADATLAAAFPRLVAETVLVEAREPGADLEAGLAAVERRLAAVPAVRGLRGPSDPGGAALLAADGNAALIRFELPAGGERAPADLVAPALAAVAAADRAHPALRIAEVGEASAERALARSIEEDFKRAELTSLPLTLAILLVVFGALVAAAVPLLLAITAVIATLGLLGPISHLAPVDEAVGSVVLLIGLAVGVDYSMFYLRRAREERARGRPTRVALETAAATSGRAVMVSGLTVMIAMGGMYVAGHPTFSSFATGTILVVAVAVAGSLTVLPALLSLLGDRVERGRVPLILRLRERLPGGVWTRVAAAVMRRPLGFGLAALALLLALAVPALGLHTASSGAGALPRGLEVARAHERVEAAFPGSEQTVRVAVAARDVADPAVAAGSRRLLRLLAAEPRTFGPARPPEVRADRTVAALTVPLVAAGSDARAERALAHLRGELIPAAFGGLPGVEVGVTGDAARSADFNALLGQRLPLVFAFVLGAAFLLLGLTFRSLVIPVTAIALNLLSVGAAYGVLVWIFQQGHLESLLGFSSTGSIAAWLPLFLFVVLFGLSMDYHVFIVSRIREAYDRGMSTERAVAEGIGSTAGVVSSAAAVMIGVFAIFATLSFLDFKQMGVGLAVAVLIDATIVRAILLPATMKLLGEWNWLMPLPPLPSRLRRPRLPRSKRTAQGAGA
jgi:RND superfamily putative drug exporter